ncbi:hypothetical protein GCM10020000_17110 [Streptomyces olivoverticillatus]
MPAGAAIRERGDCTRPEAGLPAGFAVGASLDGLGRGHALGGPVVLSGAGEALGRGRGGAATATVAVAVVPQAAMARAMARVRVRGHPGLKGDKAALWVGGSTCHALCMLAQGVSA